MSDFAAWTGDADVAVDAPVVPVAGSWLPPSIARLHEAEDRAEARLARDEKREREARVETRYDEAVASYLAGAASRGEVVTAMDMVNGTIGRTVGDVLSGATSELADRVPVAERGPREAEILHLQPVTSLAVGEEPVRRSQAPRTPLDSAMRSTMRRFTRDHPDADVLDRAEFASVAAAALRREPRVHGSEPPSTLEGAWAAFLQ